MLKWPKNKQRTHFEKSLDDLLVGVGVNFLDVENTPKSDF